MLNNYCIMQEISLFIAFTGGLLAFLSPCILPVIPGYIGYISGISSGPSKRFNWKVFLASVLFVLGFSSVFSLLGAGATTIGQLLREYKYIIAQVGGALVVFFGLHFAGVFLRKNFLKEFLVAAFVTTIALLGLYRFGYISKDVLVGVLVISLVVLVLYNLNFHNVLYRQMKLTGSNKFGILGAFFMGVFFAFGWSPCIGPVLASVLLYASQQETATQGFLMLFAFSMGMGIPFLLAGALISAFTAFIKSFSKFFGVVEFVGGVLLVVLGILLATGNLERLSYILGTFGT